MRLSLPTAFVLTLAAGCAAGSHAIDSDAMIPLARLSPAPGETARLHGRVVGTDDQPIERATVIVWTPQAPESVTTDTQGRFTLAGLSAGRHRVSVYVGETYVDTEISLAPGHDQTLVLPKIAAATIPPPDRAEPPPPIRSTTDQGRRFDEQWLRHVPHRDRTSTGALEDVSGSVGNDR